MIQKAKSRLAWNKNTKRVNVIGGYDYQKGSRATAPAMLLASIVLGIFSMGYGQFKTMIETWEQVAEASNYQAPVVIEKEIVREIRIARVTAYSCGGLKTDAEILMNCPSLYKGEPKTANGTTPIAYKTMACDSANMGKTFELDGIGQVKCTDTGGAIKGAGRFDLYVETVEEARAFGVQYIEYFEVK